jgi:hypothetical protein
MYSSWLLVLRKCGVNERGEDCVISAGAFRLKARAEDRFMREFTMNVRTQIMTKQLGSFC